MECLKSGFHENKNMSEGLNFWCKVCMKEYYYNKKNKIPYKSRIYYLGHKERKMNFRKKNRDKINEHRKQYKK